MPSEVGELRISPFKASSIVFILAAAGLLYYSVFSIPDGVYEGLGFELPVFTTGMERFMGVALLLIMLWGIGYSFTYGLLEENSFYESNVMRLLIGLGSFPIISIILNYLLHLPIDIGLLLPISLVVPAYGGYRMLSMEGERPAIPKKIVFTKELAYFSIVFFIAAATLAVLSTGAFNYPWVENGDGWRHAGGVKYIAVQKTYMLPKGVPVSDTLEPYPPTYDGLLALLNQRVASTQWSMKFFTSMLPALGVFGLYFFVKKFTGSPEIALLSALIMASMPSYSSHFIWAYTLGFILFFPAFYSLEHVRGDRKWMLPATAQVSSLMVIQALIAPTFGIFFMIYYVLRGARQRNLLPRIFAVGAIGLVLSIAVYWMPMYQKYWGKNAGKLNDIDQDFSKGVFKIDHEGRTYPLSEFFNAPHTGNIAVHHGVGYILFTLFLLSVAAGLYFRKEMALGPYWGTVLLGWTVFAFIGIQSYALPIHFLPGRFWMIITFPVAVFSAWGLIKFGGLIGGDDLTKIGFVCLVAAGILYTSAYPRYSVQTAIWPMDFFHDYRGHLEGYLALAAVEPDTPTYTFCMQDDKVISFDKMAYPWDRESLEFRGWSFPYRGHQDSTEDIVLKRSARETYEFLSGKGFKLAILCPECLEQCKRFYNETDCIAMYQDFAEKLSKHPNLRPAQIQNSPDIIFQVE